MLVDITQAILEAHILLLYAKVSIIIESTMNRRNNNGYYFGFLQSAARGKGPVRDPQGVPGTGIAPPKAGAREFVLVNNDESRPCETAFGSIAPSLGCGIAPVQG